MAKSSGNKAVGCLVIIAIIVIVALVNSIVQYIKTNPIYKEAHTAYLKGDCATAGPLYEEVIAKDRMFDFAGVKAKSKIEKDDCDVFTTAVEQGLVSFYDFIKANPDNPLSQNADLQVSSMLEVAESEGEASTILDGIACMMQGDFLSAGMLTKDGNLPQFLFVCSKTLMNSGDLDQAFDNLSQLIEEFPNHTVTTQVWDSLEESTDLCPLFTQINQSTLFKTENYPKFLFNCSKYQLNLGDMDQAFSSLQQLLEDYPSHTLSSEIWESFEQNTDFCPLLTQMSQSSLFTSQTDQYANILFVCGNHYYQQDDYDQALIAYQMLLDQFPEHSEAEIINQRTAELLVIQANASGAGTIERPDSSGWAPDGIARVVIQNDSPHNLRIVFSGTGSLIEELPACEDCSDYSMIGPIYCPEKGPIGTYDLIPGTFSVLVETTDEGNVNPFTGVWELEGGKEFYSCFVLITSYR